MRRRSRTRIVAAVVPVALIMAVSQVPSASAAAAGVTSVTVAGSFDSELGCAADWSPPCAQAHLTARADGKFEGTFTIPASTDGLPYQYKFATNDDWSNPNFGLQGGSGNAVLRIPAGGATVTFVFDPATNLGSDSINSVALAGNFQTQLGCPANDDKACPQSWLYDLDGDGVYTLATGAIAAGTYQVSAITGLGTGDSSGRRRSPCRRPAAAPPRPSASIPRPRSCPPRWSRWCSRRPPPSAIRRPAAATSWPTSGPGTGSPSRQECTTVLGPAGYGAVQVAPPENSINNPSSIARSSTRGGRSISRSTTR